MDLFKFQLLLILIVTLLFPLTFAKGGRGGSRSGSSSRGKSSSSSSSSSKSSSSSSSSSGSSYPKQQWSSGGSVPSSNYGQSSGSGYNYAKPSAPSGGYGQPSAPIGGYGQPSAPIGGYAKPSAPVAGYGQPSAPIGGYGQPSAPIGGYGQPSAPFGGYGQPNAPIGGYGQPSAPIGGYGKPGASIGGYGTQNGGYNYGQPNVGGGLNYGQPNFGSNPNHHKSSSSSAKAAVGGAVVGAAVGAYATHKIHNSLNHGYHFHNSNGDYMRNSNGDYMRNPDGDYINNPNGPHNMRPHGNNGYVSGTHTSRRRPLKIRHIFLSTVSRNEWNANRLNEINIRPGDSFSKVIVHHTNSSDCYNLTTCTQVLKQVEQRNMLTKNIDNIGYNFMIGGDGKIYENLAWSMYSTITKSTSINPISLQVAFIGDFSVYRPNEKQLDAFEALIMYGDKKDLLKKYKIHGHRDLTCTTCPGDVLYAWIKTLERYQPLLDTAEMCAGIHSLSGGGTSGINLPESKVSEVGPIGEVRPRMNLPDAEVRPRPNATDTPTVVSDAPIGNSTRNITALLSDDENFNLLFN